MMCSIIGDRPGLNDGNALKICPFYNGVWAFYKFFTRSRQPRSRTSNDRPICAVKLIQTIINFLMEMFVQTLFVCNFVERFRKTLQVWVIIVVWLWQVTFIYGSWKYVFVHLG